MSIIPIVNKLPKDKKIDYISRGAEPPLSAQGLAQYSANDNDEHGRIKFRPYKLDWHSLLPKIKYAALIPSSTGENQENVVESQGKTRNQIRRNHNQILNWDDIFTDHSAGKNVCHKATPPRGPRCAAKDRRNMVPPAAVTDSEDDENSKSASKQAMSGSIPPIPVRLSPMHVSSAVSPILPHESKLHAKSTSSTRGNNREAPQANDRLWQLIDKIIRNKPDNITQQDLISHYNQAERFLICRECDSLFRYILFHYGFAANILSQNFGIDANMLKHIICSIIFNGYNYYSTFIEHLKEYKKFVHCKKYQNEREEIMMMIENMIFEKKYSNIYHELHQSV